MYRKRKANLEEEKEKAFTLRELQDSSEAASEMMKRVKTYIVLSVYYPNFKSAIESVKP